MSSLPPIEDLVVELAGGERTVAPLEVVGARRSSSSCFDVTGFASASVALAGVRLAELVATRNGVEPPAVRVDTGVVTAAFTAELLFEPEGWERPAIWDPIAGDYEASDGWIRLHTNYASHRGAALRALGIADDDRADRETVGRAAATRAADELERAVVEQGGCAAALRTATEWSAHPQGTATAATLPVAVTGGPDRSRLVPTASSPLAGVRVLDLTRVIAGPVCTRYLAAHGAEVLRVDPPGFDEVPALLPETTWGKRCASLDLRGAAGRDRLLELVRGADVLVHGLRPGALEALDIDEGALRGANPELIVARLDAYGWSGPWQHRRGFDSLVQMSTGIAHAGQVAYGTPGPKPLPAQALDHGTGYLMAAAVLRSLAQGRADDLHAALVGSANVVLRHPDPHGPAFTPPSLSQHARSPRVTAWGPAHGVAVPDVVAGWPATPAIPAGPLGTAPPVWA